MYPSYDQPKRWPRILLAVAVLAAGGVWWKTRGASHPARAAPEATPPADATPAGFWEGVWVRDDFPTLRIRHRGRIEGEYAVVGVRPARFQEASASGEALVFTAAVAGRVTRFRLVRKGEDEAELSGYEDPNDLLDGYAKARGREVSVGIDITQALKKGVRKLGVVKRLRQPWGNP